MARALPCSGTLHGPCYQLSMLQDSVADCSALSAASSSPMEQPSSCWFPVLEFMVSYIQLGCHSGFPARSLKLGVLIANWIEFYYTAVVHELELLPFCELIRHQANVVLDASISFLVIIKRLWKIVRARWLNRTTLLISAHTPAPGAGSSLLTSRSVSWRLLPHELVLYSHVHVASLSRCTQQKGRLMDGF